VAPITRTTSTPSIPTANEVRTRFSFSTDLPTKAAKTVSDKQEIAEKLQPHIFRDGSVLEVFANDRFALSTMVYIDVEKEASLSAFVESTVGAGAGASAAIFEDARVWEMCDSIIEDTI
jgi:hypothetical protein